MPASREDWGRVGALLIERRIGISPRYANRRAFADDTGMNWRMLYDAENGKRATFKPETVRAFEAAYRLAPGSLERTLAGGPLEPAPAPPPRPAPVREDQGDAASVLFPGDRSAQALWRLDEPDDVKAALIAELRDLRRHPRQQDGPAARSAGL